MPVEGMTDKGMGFPEIGIIRKGAPKSGNAPGKDLDYFRVVFDEAETDTMKAFVALYGTSPRAIKILLPFDDIAQCWDAWVEAYTAGGLVYRGDGRRALHWVDPETGEFKVKDGKPYADCVGPDGLVGHYVTQGGKREPIYAKALGRLRVIVPELKRLAYLKVVTSSKWDVMHLSEQLAGLRQVNLGRLAGIPLVLKRRPEMVSIPLKGKRARVKKWLIHLEAEHEWAAKQFESLEIRALPEMPETKQLAAPTTIDNATGQVESAPSGKLDAEIANEFDAQEMNPLTRDLYTNESNFKDETIVNYTALVNEAIDHGVVMPFNLQAGITAKEMIDRVGSIKAAIETARKNNAANGYDY